jgi:hypothetical protein
LNKYLKKLKDAKSDYVVKIYELIYDQNSLLLITEQVTYSNLKKALISSQRLDEQDSIFISKSLLSGHTDLLRVDCNWFGTEEDV